MRKRDAAVAAVAFAVVVADISAVALLASLGAGLQASQLGGFILAVALCAWRFTAQDPSSPASQHRLQLAAVVLLALFLRGSVLALLARYTAVPPPVAAVFAAPLSTLALWIGFDCALAQRPAAPRWRAWVTALIVYSFALRALFAGSIELLPEETYYWNYSRHLDLSYLDHPPMVAWLIRAGTALFGQCEFGVRFAALLCGAITAVFTYRSTRELFGAHAALAALLLTQTLPFFFLAGILMTPDAPLTAAWAGCLYYMQRALLQAQARAWWQVGASLGLGLISKYTILLLGAVGAVFMLLDPAARKWWRRYQPYLAAAIALLIFLPVLIWNWRHDWASFAFQTTRRLADRPHFSLHRLIISALVVLTPTGLAAVVAALRAGAAAATHTDAGVGARAGAGLGAGASAPRLRELVFFRVAVFLPMAVFGVFSLRHEVKIDWTGAPWAGALSMMALSVVPASISETRPPSRLPAVWAPTLCLTLLLLGGFFCHLTVGLPGLAYSTHIEWMPVGWRDFAQQVVDYRATATRGGQTPVIVGMDRYAVASEMAFYGERYTGTPLLTSSAHLFEGVGLMYARWTPAASFDSKTLLLVAQNAEDLSGRYVESHVQRMDPIHSLTLMHDGKFVRDVYYRLAYGYHSVASP